MKDPRKANILVTGGSGFMGSSFIRFLFEENVHTGKVVNVDALSYAANPEALKAIETSSRYRFYQANILQKDLMEKILMEEEIDLIVHFAAESHVDRSIEEPSIFLDTNIKGTQILLELLRKMPFIHFHQISTDEVFGSLGESGVFFEESPYRPNSPYSASKAAADHFVRAYGRTYGLSTTISHAVNNFGPWQNREKFLPKLIDKTLRKEKFPLYGRGDEERSWLFVEDHSRAVWTILEKAHPGCSYNIPGTITLSNKAVIAQFLSIYSEKKQTSLQLEDVVKWVENRAGHDFRYALDGKKLQDLGYTHKVSFEEGLKKTLNWYEKRFNKASLHR